MAQTTKEVYNEAEGVYEFGVYSEVLKRWFWACSLSMANDKLCEAERVYYEHARKGAE